MDSESDFRILIDRVRAGDADAASAVVSRFTPEVRRFIRYRLSSATLRRVFDSLDVCQSVLGKFFVQLSAGELQLDRPEQLKALLLTMARNRLYDRVRGQQAARRDSRRLDTGTEDALLMVADQSDSPSKIVAAQEVLAAVRTHLDDDENRLVDRRMSGATWEELANEFAASPEALRKRMTRALDGAAEQLGLRD